MLKNKLILIICAVSVTLSISTKVQALSNSQRIYGSDRYATAIEVSKNGWATGSEYAVLANGENFPDALSAAPLAKKYNAPILLTSGNSLDNRIEDELKRLNVKQVFIIGGPGVIPNSVDERLSKLAIKSVRLFGQDRYETSIKVAEQLDFKGELTIVNGENFPDAMSIAPIAAQKSMPIILTPMDKLPSYANNYIKSKKITNTYIIGGNDVVSDYIFNSLPNAERLYGDSRYDTNIAVLNRFSKDLNFKNIYLANGENFPDALAGSALSAKDSSAVVMVSPYSGEATTDFMSSKALSSAKVTILGGTGVVSDKTVANILRVHGNTAGNLQNGGTLSTQGDWIYYSFGSAYAGPKSDNIYAYKKDGSSKIKIDDKFAKYINVVDDWVYFSRYGDENGIYKVKTDGTNETKLYNNFICNSLTVIGDKIYFISGTLYRMDTDGSNLIPLGKDSIYSISISDNHIYYQNTAELSTLYKMNLDGSGKTKVSDAVIDNFSYIVDNGWIYFTTDSKLYKMKTDGSEKANIIDSEISYYNISNGWIYYTNKKDGHLYKVKVDGSDNTKISDDYAVEINIDNDWIYYYLCDSDFHADPIALYRMHLDGSQKELIE